MQQTSADVPAATILVVDDNPENLAVLGGTLQPHYRVTVANSGPRALLIAGREPAPDLILLDVMMPGMDGYTVLAQLRENPATSGIPVIFVTAMDSDEDEEHGLELGAVDYITKPIRPPIVLARLRAHLELKRARDWLADQNAWLESEVARRLRDNTLMQDVSIRALANLAEVRDMETGNHIKRTQAYVEVLAQHLSGHPSYADYLTPTMARLVAKAAPLHDIGKVGIPDQILLKPARLTPDEFAVMKRHSVIGGDAIEAALRAEIDDDDFRVLQRHCSLGGKALESAMDQIDHPPLAFLAVAREIALWHHEKWDGSGYPDGLAGDAIPIPARIMAVADVFDALASRRIYKDAMSFEEAVELIREGSGQHFDPGVVQAFMDNLDSMRDVLMRYADSDEILQAKRMSMPSVGEA